MSARLFFFISFFSLVALAETPPIIDIFKLKGETRTGAIKVDNGVISEVSPGPSGNVLKSNGSTWISGPAPATGVTSVTASSPLASSGGTTPNISLASPVPIALGGTGQTTANTALNALLPSQATNAGKSLVTDGSNTSWQAAAGSGTVTNVSSGDGSLDITNPTTVPDVRLHFPISAPGGTVGAPSYRFDSDTGMYSTGDGTLDFATNATKALEINNNQQAVFTNTVAATDFIYPAKAANTFLAGPTSGSAAPSFRLIQPGDLTYDDIPYPLNAPGGSAGAPSINFDSDSGMFSPSDGIVAFSTNGVERLRLENNGDVIIANGGSGTLTVNGNGTFTGNISAANYPPTNSANTLARFNNSGVLDASSWLIDPDYSSLTNIVSPASGTVTDFWQLRTQTNLSSTITGTARALWLSLGSSGTTNALVGMQLGFDLPVDTDATLFSLGSSSTTTVGGNLRALDISIDSPTVGDFILSNAGTTNTVGGNYTGYYLNAGNTITGNGVLYAGSFFGSTTGDLNFVNMGSNGNTGNNFRAMTLSNNGTVAQFGSGYAISQSGAVTKGYDAFTANISANVGDGTGINLNFLNATVGSGVTVDGNLFLSSLGNQADVTGQIFGSSITTSGAHAGINGWTLNNSGNMTGNNTIFGVSITNSGTGYSFTGANYNNQGALSEQFMGFNVQDNGGARTASGGNINLQGVYTDDARGLKIDVAGASSTTQVVQGLEVNGGKQTITGSYKPPSSAFVDIGSYFSQTATIDSGSPLTGTDMFEQFIQSNLAVNDDIALGPLSLGTNLVGMVSQASVASGKTVPMLRALLLGTSIPAGTGGTITEHHVLGILGLPSFGGSVTNPTRVGLIDEAILGQNFCDGATDCWFIKNQDPNSQNTLARLAIGTPQTAAEVKLEVSDGHIRSDQTTPPTATPDGTNAGTGATCTVSGTDSDGSIELITGSAGWLAGSQCAVTFDATYNSAPKCTFSPTNGNAALAAMNAYFTKTTTDLVINFVNADTAATTYDWDYHCVETN